MSLERAVLESSIGVTQAGEWLVWGRMDGAQIGLDISTLPVDDPKKVISEYGRPRILVEPTVVPIEGCSFVAAGSDHNVLITSQGKAYSWGFNTNYQCVKEQKGTISQLRL
jgi:regulator of chromosome condensation